MLIVACVIFLKGESLYFTGTLVKEGFGTYFVSTADGYYEFPKENCIVKKYRRNK